MRKLLKKYFFYFLLFFTFSLFAQEAEIVPWHSVVGGDIVAPPKLTSYGFISISDGRILNASTEEGTVIWREYIKGKPSEFFSVTECDFIYLTTDNCEKLSLYNPDGRFLWTIELESPAIADPFSGQDGRVFIQEKNALSCYGTKGSEKWRLELPESTLPLVELNDGSLLYILLETKNNASVGIRVSPYGEILEEINFFDIIKIVKSHEKGVILGFENGQIGNCSVIKQKLVHTWSAENSKSTLTPIEIIIGETGFCVLFSNGIIREYSLETQEIFWQTTLPQEFIDSEYYFSYINNGYVFATINSAIFYASNKFGAGGTLIWQKSITYQGNAFFPIITQSGYLVLSHDNWVISGYKLAEFSEKKVPQKIEKPDNSKSYQIFYPKKNIVSYDMKKMLSTIQSGNYGILEAEYKKYLDFNIAEYQLEYMNSKKNMIITSKSQILFTTAFFESSHYNYVVKTLLENEKEAFYITLALQIAASIAYDPQGIMLQSIKTYYYKNKSRLTDSVTIELSNAIFSISRYMGNSAFLNGGKEIIFDILEYNRSLFVQQQVQKNLHLFIEFEK